jgi:hypothetical protein
MAVSLNDIKDVAAITSLANKVSNRAWLALVAACAVVLLPRQAGDTVTLPFGFGGVDSSTFQFVVLPLLIALCVGFAAAHAQAYRAQFFASAIIDGIQAVDCPGSQEIHPRDLFDMFQEPSLNRVAPLAQLVSGTYGAKARSRKPLARGLLFSVYYVTLKIAAFMFIFLLPAFALQRAYGSAPLSGWWLFLGTFGTIVAGLALAQVMLADLIYVLRVVTRFVQWR